jgi:hypothetical protein
MSGPTIQQHAARATLRAARKSRREILASALALGAVGAVAPAFVRKAFSSSGELNWFTWEDYAPQPLIDRFTKDTGIKLKVTTYSSNEDCLNKLKASGGKGWDMASPSIAWIAAHVDNGNLGALDEAKLPHLPNIFPSFRKTSAELGAQRDGKWYALPYDWGTEALAYNTDQVKLVYGTASFGDIWNPEYKGKMLCRQRSSMLTTGLWMEREGKLPAGTMRKAYDDEAAFDLGYGTAAKYVIEEGHRRHPVRVRAGRRRHRRDLGRSDLPAQEPGPALQLPGPGGGRADLVRFDRDDRRRRESRPGLCLHQLVPAAGDRRHRLRQHRLQLGRPGLRSACRGVLQEELRRRLSR